MSACSYVSFVSFEAPLGKVHEGIFISKPSPKYMQATEANALYSVNTEAELPNRDRGGINIGYHHSANDMVRVKQLIEGTFIELYTKKDRTSSRLKVQHFFELNDRRSQRMVCLRHIGKITSISNFFFFLKRVALPSPSSHIIVLERSYPSAGHEPVNEALSKLVPRPPPYDQRPRYLKPLAQVCREWYVQVIREAEIQKAIRRTF